MIKCPECGKSGKYTIFPEADNRLWRCDECGYVVDKDCLKMIESYRKELEALL